jgi:hypothetical protein
MPAQDTQTEVSIVNDTLPIDYEYQMDPTDISRIKKILKEHFLFQNLDEQTITKVLSEFKLKSCPKGSYIYKQG